MESQDNQNGKNGQKKRDFSTNTMEVEADAKPIGSTIVTRKAISIDTTEMSRRCDISQPIIEAQSNKSIRPWRFFHRLSQQEAGADAMTISGIIVIRKATTEGSTETGRRSNASQPIPVTQINKSRFYAKQRNLMDIRLSGKI